MRIITTNYWLFFFISDLWHCCWPGGPVSQGGPAEVGPEDDPQVPRGPGPGLHAVMERWTGFQCHHSQKQVSQKTIFSTRVMKRGSVILHFRVPRFSKPLMLCSKLFRCHHRIEPFWTNSFCLKSLNFISDPICWTGARWRGEMWGRG